jgi:hypothetical protein
MGKETLISIVYKIEYPLELAGYDGEERVPAPATK